MLPVFRQNHSKLCGKHNNNNEQQSAGFLRFKLLFCENCEPVMTKSYPTYALNSKQFLRELQIILGKLPIFRPKHRNKLFRLGKKMTCLQQETLRVLRRTWLQPASIFWVSHFRPVSSGRWCFLCPRTCFHPVLASLAAE